MHGRFLGEVDMLRYHYRIVEVSGFTHSNWMFADSLSDAWLRLAQVVGRMKFEGAAVASIHIDEVTQ